LKKTSTEVSNNTRTEVAKNEEQGEKEKRQGFQKHFSKADVPSG